MDTIRKHVGLVSVVGGILFGLALFWVGGLATDPAGLLLPVLVGSVFAIAMYSGGRRSTH